MKEVFVKDIEPGDTITEYFALRKSELLEKDGHYRLSVELGDRTGRIKAIKWDASAEEAEIYQTGIIVKVRGPVSVYMGRNQIRIDRIRAVTDDSEIDINDYFRSSNKSKESLSGELDLVVEKIENSYLKKLLTDIFQDEELRDKYLTAPAGKLLHHDTIGGLAEHSLNVAELTIRSADLYPALDRDIVICGALLHDIGKIWELKISTSIDYTDAGRLIGHINQGDEYVCGIADSIEHFPEELLVHLRHLMVSHHGEKEYGSPVLPQTAEALFLHHADELDSRMGAIEKIRERTGGSGWSSYQQIFNRFFYFGQNNPTEDEEEK